MKMTKDLFSDLCKEGLAYLYIIKCFDDLEEFYKVGVTSKENGKLIACLKLVSKL